MTKDIEQQLKEYPVLPKRISILKERATLLRKRMDDKTEALLDDKHLDETSKQLLVESLQESEKILFKLLKVASELELQYDIITAALSILTPKENIVISEYYFKEKSIEEIRCEIGYSYSWVHKLKAKALTKLIDLLADE